MTDVFDLRDDMQFGCHVKSAAFDDGAKFWILILDDGRTLSTRFLLTAIGILSAHTMATIEGVDNLEGKSLRT